MLEAEVIKLTAAVVNLTAAIKDLHEHYSPPETGEQDAVLFPATPQIGRPRHPSVDELLVALQEMTRIFERDPEEMKAVVRKILARFDATRIGDLKEGKHRLRTLELFRKAALSYRANTDG